MEEKANPVNCYSTDLQGFMSDLGGARTHDPLIKSQLLYQLSYEVKLLGKSIIFGNQYKEKQKISFTKL